MPIAAANAPLEVAFCKNTCQKMAKPLPGFDKTGETLEYIEMPDQY